MRKLGASQSMTTVKMNSMQRIELLLNAFLVLLLVNAGHVHSANAPHPLRSSIFEIEKGLDADDNRDLQQAPTVLPPSNDDCSGAVVIPSSFPGDKDTYTTSGVSIESATMSTSPPHHRCNPKSRTKDVWYTFQPSTTNTYGFSTNLGGTSAQIAIFSSIDNSVSTCQNSYRFVCPIERPSYDIKLRANYTYFLAVQPVLANATGSLQLTVQRRRPPSNNQCTNATIIDPTVETNFTIHDSANALHDTTADFSYFSPCYTYDNRNDPPST